MTKKHFVKWLLLLLLIIGLITLLSFGIFSIWGAKALLDIVMFLVVCALAVIVLLHS